jgi:nucleotide-binding universal stress UspA family protein
VPRVRAPGDGVGRSRAARAGACDAGGNDRLRGAQVVFKDILFTVDLEHFATWEKALPVALHEAKASGGRLHVMTVVPEVAVPALMQVGPFDYETQLVPKAREALEQFVRERVPAEVPVHPIATYGSVYKEILRVAAEIPADLVVMAAHRPQPGDFLIGSNAERVSRRAPCTVMLVR